MTVTPDRLTGDLGWGLAVVFRSYVKAADTIAEDIPGGHRGYQVLSAAARDDPGSQAAMAQRLGIDRTVMTYLLDDLEAARLVERQADPADRRSRRVVATDHGREVLADLDERFGRAEGHLLAGLDVGDQAHFRRLLREVATHANASDHVPTTCDAVEDVSNRLRSLPAVRAPSKAAARAAASASADSASAASAMNWRTARTSAWSSSALVASDPAFRCSIDAIPWIRGSSWG